MKPIVNFLEEGIVPSHMKGGEGGQKSALFLGKLNKVAFDDESYHEVSGTRNCLIKFPSHMKGGDNLILSIPRHTLPHVKIGKFPYRCQ